MPRNLKGPFVSHWPEVGFCRGRRMATFTTKKHGETWLAIEKANKEKIEYETVSQETLWNNQWSMDFFTSVAHFPAISCHIEQVCDGMGQTSSNIFHKFKLFWNKLKLGCTDRHNIHFFRSWQSIQWQSRVKFLSLKMEARQRWRCLEKSGDIQMAFSSSAFSHLKYHKMVAKYLGYSPSCSTLHGIPSGYVNSLLLKMAIYSEFSH